ncbi:hypothetical protein ZWY2020_047396 [Hordeum vulgare]|nr:hypothetical protein ZWY2020_047396 [Hordeum vulgare]
MEHPPTLRFPLQLQILLSLVLSLAFLTTTITQGQEKKEEEEDQFVYSGFSGGGGTGLGLTLDGTATVTPDGVLKLTNGTLHLKGHAFYPTPCRFRKSPDGVVQSFSVTFVFGMVPVYSDQCTDGMTFLISPTKDFSGAQHSQYLGLLNKTTDGKPSNQIFAVELDSSQNTEFGDIDDNHVGIDINSLTSTQVRPAGFYDDKKGGAFNNLTLVSRKEMQVWVDYDADITKITVTLAPLKVAKPSRPLVSATYNLSTVLRDESSYLGFSASTGPINSLYCVLGWSLGINRPAPDIDISKLPRLPRIGPKPRPKVVEIVLPIASATFIFLVGTSIVLLVRRRRKLYEHGTDPQTTRVVGTMGYFAPELARTGKATPLTDVYAFGIFILEVTCGRRPIVVVVDKGVEGVEEDDGSEILVDWVVEHCRKGSLMETVDMRLQGSISDPDEVCLALKIGLLCAHPFGNVRPSMRQVMQYLDGETPVPELMPTTLSYSMMGVLQNDGFSDYASLSATVSSRNGITSSSSFSAGR